MRQLQLPLDVLSHCGEAAAPIHLQLLVEHSSLDVPSCYEGSTINLQVLKDYSCRTFPTFPEDTFCGEAAALTISMCSRSEPALDVPSNHESASCLRSTYEVASASTSAHGATSAGRAQHVRILCYLLLPDIPGFCDLLLLKIQLPPDLPGNFDPATSAFGANATGPAQSSCCYFLPPDKPTNSVAQRPKHHSVLPDGTGCRLLRRGELSYPGSTARLRWSPPVCHHLGRAR